MEKGVNTLEQKKNKIKTSDYMLLGLVTMLFILEYAKGYSQNV